MIVFFFTGGLLSLVAQFSQFSPGLGWSGGSAVFVTPTLHGGALLGYTGVAPKV
jgi:hypothetical protein